MAYCTYCGTHADGQFCDRCGTMSLSPEPPAFVTASDAPKIEPTVRSNSAPLSQLRVGKTERWARRTTSVVAGVVMAGLAAALMYDLAHSGDMPAAPSVASQATVTLSPDIGDTSRLTQADVVTADAQAGYQLAWRGIGDGSGITREAADQLCNLIGANSRSGESETSLREQKIGCYAGLNEYFKT